MSQALKELLRWKTVGGAEDFYKAKECLKQTRWLKDQGKRVITPIFYLFVFFLFPTFLKFLFITFHFFDSMDFLFHS